MGGALSHVDPRGENQPMDALAWIVLLCVAAALVRALLPTVAPGMKAHVAALGQLFGGWRPLPWPHGVQEDDPEAAWATHRRQPASSDDAASIEYLD
jgi:hypothetical protein